MTQRTLTPLSLLCLSLLVAMPAGSVIPTGFSQVVLFASDSMHLKMGVDVASGSVVVDHGGAATELRLEKEVTTAAGYALKADSIDIKKDSVIGGDVHYNELTNAGTIQGNLITPLALPVFPFLPPFFTGPAAGPDVVVPDGGAAVLAAGDYGAVTVGLNATLTFSGGTYNVASITAGEASRMEFDATSAVRVAGAMLVEKDSYVGPSAIGPAASELVIYVAGVGLAVDFEKNAEVAVSIYAPNGTLDINKDSHFTGAFLAKDIVVDVATQFVLESYFFNRPPVAEDDGPFVTAEDGHIPVIDVLANDSDPDNDNLAITPTPTAPFGVVTINDSGTPGDPTDDTLSYTPNPDSNDNEGDHSFQYEVCDDGTDPGPLCDTATVFISVTPVNDPPVANDQAASTDEDTALALVLTGDDGDPHETQTLTFAIDTPPSHGTLSGFDTATGAVTYTPALNYNGPDAFSFTVTDDATAGGPPLTSAPATVSITVLPVNDPPVVNDQSVATDELTPAVIVLTGTDVENDGLTYSLISVDFGSPPIGSLQPIVQGPPTLPVNAAEVTFVPTGDGTLGVGSFVYEVCDDGTPPGPECDQATVTVEVVEFNNPPVAQHQTVFTGGAMSVPITLSASDVEDPILDFALVSGPSKGSLSGLPASGGSVPVTYAPFNPSLEEPDTFVFRACDSGVPVKCGNGIVTINSEEPLNNPPHATPQSAVTNGDVNLPLVLTGSDPDGDTLTFSITSVPSFGVLVGLTDVPPTSATVTYDPNTGDDLEDAFAFQVCDDGTPVLCATALVSINPGLETDNSPPVANADAIRLAPGATTTVLFPSGTSLLANDTDPNSDPLTLTTTPVSGPSAGTLTLFANGTFSYTNTNTSATSDQFVYEACDDGAPPLCDTATVFITIVPASMDVSITKSGSGTGSVSSSPAGIDCGITCSFTFDTATALPVTLIAVADEGSVFGGWGGSADCADGVLSVAANASCIAVFNVFSPPTGDPITVNMFLAGAGSGRVESTPAGIDCGPPVNDCTEVFPFNTRVTFVATADPGSTFAGFSGDADCFDGELMGAFNTNCTATFDLLPEVQHTLTILFAGDGNGSVRSADLTLVCTADCSGLFGDGETVILNARPDEGSTFGGYGAGCGTVSGFRATLVMGGDQTCTVTFNGP